MNLLRRFFFIALLLTGTFTFAQKQKPVPPPPPVLPVDSITKLITYEEVVPVKDVAATVLYKRMNDWFHTFYKNPSEAIRENDSVGFKIVAKPRFMISNPPDKTGFKTDGGIVQYTITVSAREGRFKYELTTFNWKQLSYYPCERWFDTKSQFFTTAYYDYLQQLDQYVKNLVGSLKSAVMVEKPVKDKDKW